MTDSVGEQQQRGNGIGSCKSEISYLEDDEKYPETKRIAARSSAIDSFKACGLAGLRIDQEELRKRLIIPEYLRIAMVEAVRNKEFVYDEDRHRSDGTSTAPEAAFIVFVNSKSGGRRGPTLKARLQEIISKEQSKAMMDSEGELQQRGNGIESHNSEISYVEDDDKYPETKHIAARSSVIDTFKPRGLAGLRIDKEQLKKKLIIPEYLRIAMAEAVCNQEFVYDENRHRWDGTSAAPEAAVIVFINLKSGGRHGHTLQARLQELISEEQVFDLSDVKPSDFLHHGLGCLEKLASFGDHCAQETRDRIRIMAAGGDGTVGWILGSIVELCLENHKRIPPVGVIPLGTGNDLARSFGWGGSFPILWRSAVKRYLDRAVSGQICRLDSWQIMLTPMIGGQELKLPPTFRPQQAPTHQIGYGIEDGSFSNNSTSYKGTFYNYFSIGMDAQIAYGFHHLRNEKPYLARGPITNKIIYSGYGCAQGWFCTPFSANPRVRGINKIVQIHIKRQSCSDWEILRIPSSVRSVVALNLHNYASGRNPWGHPRPDYLEKRGFVEAHPDDGLLEIFGLKEGWHSSFVMLDLITAMHLAQVAAIKLELRSVRRKRAYLQMDGEPWQHPLSESDSTMIEITRVPFQSLMISGE